MINRWFHRPRLHVADDGMERKVSWIELFYDLIYVAAIIQLGNALSNHVGLLGVFGFAGLFVPIWLTWTGFTFYSNRFLVDDFVHRAVVFVQMFGIGAMAVYVPDVLVGDPRGFALSYVVVRLALVIMYARAWRQVPEGRDLARRYTLGFGAGVLIWAASIFVPSPWVYLVWAVGIGVEFSAVLSRAAREVIGRYPPDSRAHDRALRTAHHHRPRRIVREGPRVARGGRRQHVHAGDGWSRPRHHLLALVDLLRRRRGLEDQEQARRTLDLGL